MLESLKLVNFQGHRKTVLKFHPHLNWITGATDRGKSSIMRSTQVLTTNKPTGTSYVRNGKAKTHIVATVVDTDGKSCIRFTKSKTGKAVYKVDERVFAGMGRTVPDGVSKALRIDPDVCIQRQSEPYFLLSLRSAPERARFLAAGSNLHTITTAVTNSRKNSNAQRKLHQEAEAEAKAYRDRLRMFKPLKLIRRLTKRADQAFLESDRIESAAFKLRSLETALRKCADRPDLSGVLAEDTSIQLLLSKLDKLSALKKALSTLDKRTSIDANALTVLGYETERLEQDRNSLTIWQESVLQIQGETKTANEMIQKLGKELKGFDACPLCGTRRSKCTK